MTNETPPPMAPTTGPEYWRRQHARLPSVLREHVIPALVCEAEPHVIADAVSAVEEAASVIETLQEAQQSAATGGEGPYLSQADAWNDALEKSAEIVERYNASFEDPECGGAPDDIRALKRPTTPSNPPAPSDVDQTRTTVLEWLNGRPLSIATPTPLDAIRLITDFTGERR